MLFDLSFIFSIKEEEGDLDGENEDGGENQEMEEEVREEDELGG